MVTVNSNVLNMFCRGHKRTREVPVKRPKLEDPGEGALPESIPAGPGTCPECDEKCEDLPEHMANIHQVNVTQQF